jgi:putative oxidoreductase
MTTTSATRVDLGLLVLRASLAVIVLLHGIFKISAGVSWMAQPLAAFGLPSFVAYGVYVAEIVAPVLLIAGAWTRLAALVIAFDMAMAVLLVLRSRLFALNEAGGWAIELEALIFFAALALWFTGGGRYVVQRAPSRWN